MSNQRTFIDLPPPPADPVTPSEVPSRSGTPNSTTTSMSELSTVAIKDGHRGHLPHHHAHGSSGQLPASGLHNQLDAERADRISRLAGLERVTTARNPGSAAGAATPPAAGNLTPGATTPAPQATATTSYFDASGNPAIGRERSTVGSASATGSVGARTTWAGSEAGDADKMSESQDMDMDASSVGGMSEEGTASLVGFGEGARTPARQSVISSSGGGGKSATPTLREAKMIDGITSDRGLSDTPTSDALRPPHLQLQQQHPNLVGNNKEEAERIVRENMNTTSNDRMMRGTERQAALGKFGFES